MVDQECHNIKQINQNFETIFNNKEIMVLVFTPHCMMTILSWNFQPQFCSNVSFWQHVMVILYNLVTRQTREMWRMFSKYILRDSAYIKICNVTILQLITMLQYYS